MKCANMEYMKQLIDRKSLAPNMFRIILLQLIRYKLKRLFIHSFSQFFFFNESCNLFK